MRAELKYRGKGNGADRLEELPTPLLSEVAESIQYYDMLPVKRRRFEGIDKLMLANKLVN